MHHTSHVLAYVFNMACVGACFPTQACVGSVFMLNVLLDCNCELLWIAFNCFFMFSNDSFEIVALVNCYFSAVKSVLFKT